MIEYLKTVVVAVVTAVTTPLPVSSAAHFNYFANVVGLSAESNILSLYYNTFIFVFSLVVFFAFRKTVCRGFRLGFSKKSEPGVSKPRDNKYFIKNILFSLIPAPLLFIPVSENKLAMDYLDTFLNVNGLILAGFACVISAMILIIAIWYTSKSKNPVRRAVDKKTVLRIAVYQLPCYIIPGFSHIASGAVNLFISDIGSKSLFGQLYIYLAPSMFFVSSVKIIRLLSSGVLFDPIALLLGAVVFAVVSRLVISLSTKSDVRRLFTFFSAYSILFGVLITVTSFFI